MKRLICVLLSTMLVLSSLVAVAAGTTDLTSLVEEALTSEVKTGITEDLKLPESWNDASITWSSSDNSVINAETGVVTRGASDKTVTLTATAEDSTSKVLTFKVLGLGTKVWHNDNYYNNNTQDSTADNGVRTAVLANPYVSGDKAYYIGLPSDITKNSYPTSTIVLDTPQASGMVTFKTRLSFKGDFASLGTISYRKINFISSISNSACASLEFFGTSVKTGLRMSNDGLNVDTTNLITDGYLTLDASNNVLWFDLRVDFNFNVGEYTVTITNGDRSKSISAKLTSGKYSATSGLSKFSIGYRGYDADESGIGTYIDDTVVTTAEIAGKTDEEKLAVYQSMLEAEFMKGQDKRFVTTNIALTDIPEFDGFTVAWQSSDENVLAINGDVAETKFSEIAKPVNLIATISYGTATPVTSEFALTVHPVGTGAVNWGEDKILDFETCTVGEAPATTYAGGKLSGVTVANDANKGKIAQSNSLVKYGVSSWGDQLAFSGLMTLSLDVKYDEPAGFNGRDLHTSITMNHMSSKKSAQIGFHYTFAEDDDSVYKTLYLYTNSGHIVYSGDLPELGEWFNLKILINSISRTYDVYIDDRLITENSVPFVSDSPSYLYSADFKANDAGVLTPVVQNFDNICITTAGTSNTWVNTVATLASANASDLSNLVTTGGITWSLEPTTYARLTGDSVKSVVAVEGIGKKTAVLTATATDATVGQIARVYNIEFSLDEPVKIAAINYADGIITSVITSTGRSDAQGYIAIYNGNILSEVKKFDIASGTDVTNNVNYTIPSEITKPAMKVFVWTNELVPLASVFEK